MTDQQKAEPKEQPSDGLSVVDRAFAEAEESQMDRVIQSISGTADPIGESPDERSLDTILSDAFDRELKILGNRKFAFGPDGKPVQE